MTLVWVIGSGGLLGQALSCELALSNARIFNSGVNFSWAETNLVCQELKEVATQFALQVKNDNWQIYWAAGISTMHSTEEELHKETHILKNLISVLLDIRDLNISMGTFVFASSAGAIYAGVINGLITESTPPAPINAYGKNKLLQESLVNKLNICNENNQAATIIIYRISTLYGIKQRGSKQQGLITELVRKILSNQSIHIYVPLETMRDYISAKDAARQMIDATTVFEKHPGTYLKIIASGTSTSIAQILGILKRICKRNLKVVTKLDNKSIQYQRVVQFKSETPPNTKNLKQISLVEGVAELLTSMRSEIAKNGIDLP